MKNKLQFEKSPYLLQHKDNPVWWLPWGDEAFHLANSQNKPIFLSVGYSTCHWCHVMEKDSFEKDDVAHVLNENFISIKIDREERPDIDSIYMSAVQAMTGHGGWPMSVLLTPDGKPFWAGTFVAHDSFVDLLTKVSQLWKTERENITESGERIAEYLKQNSELPHSEGSPINEKSLMRFNEIFKNKFDELNGGSLGAPKFPPALALQTLVRIFKRTNDSKTLDMVVKTLKQMRRGGIFDQVGFGFHRYTVDDIWLIPHFEKMLYDNSLLAQTYLETYQVTHDEEFLDTAAKIFEYIARDMTSPEGGFYSAEDADSENIEGKFYVWTPSELQQHLSLSEYRIFSDYLHVTEEGNFHAHKTGDEVNENRNGPPVLSGTVAYFDRNLELSSLPVEFENARQKILEARSKRVRPHLDDKILVSWNAMMISALTQGHRVFTSTGKTPLAESYLQRAKRAAQFILSNMIDDSGNLHRSYRKGLSPHKGMCEDYSLLIESLISLYESTFEPSWILKAKELQQKQDELFWDETKGAYFDNDGRDKFVIARNKNFEDSVVPSANSTSLMNHLKFFALTGELSHQLKSKRILEAAQILLEQYPQACAKILHGVDWLTGSPCELAIVAPANNTEIEESLKKIWNTFQPHLMIACTSSPKNKNEIPLLENRDLMNGKTTYYFCRNQECQLPTNDFTEFPWPS